MLHVPEQRGRLRARTAPMQILSRERPSGRGDGRMGCVPAAGEERRSHEDGFRRTREGEWNGTRRATRTGSSACQSTAEYHGDEGSTGAASQNSQMHAAWGAVNATQ